MRTGARICVLLLFFHFSNHGFASIAERNSFAPTSLKDTTSTDIDSRTATFIMLPILIVVIAVANCWSRGCCEGTCEFMELDAEDLETTSTD